MQIQINEEADNNNGPLSPADMENIENNNAVDYIPNRNEIERLVEPVVISIEMEEQQQPFFDRSNPFNEQIRNCAYDGALSNPNNPFVNIVHNENVNDEYCENQHDSSTNHTQTTVKLLDEAISLESSLSEKSFADVNSVEEALRALDFAISGEESLMHPNDDEFEYCNVNEEVMITSAGVESQGDDTITNKTTESYDADYVVEVHKEAEILVNSVIEESKNKISQGLVPTEYTLSQTYNNVVDDCVIEFSQFEGTMKERETDAQEKHQENYQYLPSVGSVENLCFENIILEASTPFIRKPNPANMPKSNATDSPIVGNATFDVALNDSESHTFNAIKSMDDTFGISPLAAETSTCQPGHTNVNGTFVKSEFIDVPQANATFDIEAKESNGIIPSLSDPKKLDETFPLDKPPNAKPVNSTFTTSSESFLKDSECDAQIKCPTIKIDKEDSTSVDMTTVTPVNTPIELNYSLDSWDQFISNSMSQELVMPKHHVEEMQPCTSAQAAFADIRDANASGWFLHSKTDGEFSNSLSPVCILHCTDIKILNSIVSDPPSVSDTFEVDDDCEENMNDTFDALRKQLIIMLPHAQGVTEHPPEFSDDDDDDDTDEKPEQRSPCENINEPQTEMVINYKRPLSPIMEESEDETCKTFVMNETKNLDSTSTGCVETGEAIMGVTKTLMASNDTLFNFEDTFGDDVFSPRTNSQNDIVKDSKVNNLNSSGASTPTPRSFKPMEFEVNDVCNNANDLLSPDQQKTLSEDICTVEHLSSDAVDTTFTTNTLEEKTCISVNIKEDEKISEISEPDWGSSGQFDLNSLNDVPSMGVLDNEDEQSQCNEFENDDSSSTVSIPKKDENSEENDHPSGNILSTHHHNGDDESYKDKTNNFLLNEINYSSSGHYNKSSEIKPIIYDNIKENADPNSTHYDRIEDSTKCDEIHLLSKNLTESGIFEGDLLNETDVIMQNSTFVSSFSDFYG